MTFTIIVHAADGEVVYKAINAQHALSRLRRCRRGAARKIEVVDDATRHTFDELMLEALTDYDPGRSQGSEARSISL